jgi:hypothetical protein
MDFSTIIRHLERKKQMHRLISNETTGTPLEFAQKIDCSRSQLYIIIESLEKDKAPIKYSKSSQTFYYDGHFELKFEFSLTITTEGETQKIFSISTEEHMNCITLNDLLCVQ